MTLNAVQTTMFRYTDGAAPGLIASPANLNYVVPRLVPSGGVAAGQYVCQDTSGTGAFVKLGTSASDIQNHGLGFVVRDASMAADGSPAYAQNKDVPVFSRGLIWVKCVESMSIDDPVYVITVSTNRGFVRNDADTGNATLLPGARVRAALTLNDGSFVALVDMQAAMAAVGATGPTGLTGPTGPTGP